MPLSKHITARAAQGNATPHLARILREVLLWNNALREFHRLQTLDADALADMGLTEASRNTVTVSQIVARMRAGA